MSIDAVEAMPTPPAVTITAPNLKPELVAGGLLITTLIIGIATASDFGLTLDEFNADEYGPKALAWYASFGTDRSQFETVEPFLWCYGPWAQILIASVQHLGMGNPITVRHAVTFCIGLAGLAALVPMARLSVGSWAGPVAILLCLGTGYLFGSLFFTPIDVPFLAVMTWTTCAIMFMAQRQVPSWSATIAAGLLSGVAISTRTGGIITHAYLAAAMTLCALEVFLEKKPGYGRSLLAIMGRTAAAVVLAWITMIALWPWLQIGNPFRQFAIAYTHFTNIPMSFNFQSWGRTVWTNALPSTYLPEQLLARLPELFIVLLSIGLVLAAVSGFRFLTDVIAAMARPGAGGLSAPVLMLARSRNTLVLFTAAIAPVAFVIVTHATHYDGIRHLLFIIPVLALIAGGASLRFVPLMRRRHLAAGLVITLAAADLAWSALTMWRLHPLEYVAFNRLAGGTEKAAGRFELDYWGAAAGEAVRILEHRLDSDRSGKFVSSPPRVFACLIDRSWEGEKLFRRNWIRTDSREDADFIIATQRWPCADDMNVVMIARMTRLGVPFATVFGNNRGRKLQPERQQAGL